jgi:hypothetical protein
MLIGITVDDELSVTNRPLMLSVIMLEIVMLCRYTECRGAWKLTRDYLKVTWAKFSTLSLTVFVYECNFRA